MVAELLKVSARMGWEYGTPKFSYDGPAGRVAVERNHNIARSLFEDPSGGISGLFGRLRETGRFNVYSFAANGTPLPGTREAANALGGGTLHAGHGIFTEAVERWGKINAAKAAFKDGASTGVFSNIFDDLSAPNFRIGDTHQFRS